MCTRLLLLLHLEELGVRREILDDLVKATPILTGGYRILTKEDVRNLFMLSMSFLFLQTCTYV